MYRTLTQRLSAISDDTTLFPGHLYSADPSAPMGDVRQHNRALVRRAPSSGSPCSRADHAAELGSRRHRGAGFGGWRLVEALRREGFDGEVTLLGEETYAPYDRPPLSKQVLAGKWDAERATLATPERIAETKVNLRLGVRAMSLDVESNTVELEDGSRVEGTHVVIATGARARRLPFSADDQILTLRNRDDELRMRLELDGLKAGSVIVVIGGGFIGAEVRPN